MYGDGDIAGMDDGLGDSSASARLSSAFGRRLQHYLDKAAPHTTARWIGAAVVTLLYCIRVYLLNGWYIVTYGLGIYLLNLLIAFLSPQVRAPPPLDLPASTCTARSRAHPDSRALLRSTLRWRVQRCRRHGRTSSDLSKGDFRSSSSGAPLGAVRAPAAACPQQPRRELHCAAPRCAQVFLRQGLPDSHVHDVLRALQHPGLLADPAAVFHHALLPHDEAPDQAHDQVQVRCWRTARALQLEQALITCPRDLCRPSNVGCREQVRALLVRQGALQEQRGGSSIWTRQVSRTRRSWASLRRGSERLGAGGCMVQLPAWQALPLERHVGCGQRATPCPRGAGWDGEVQPARHRACKQTWVPIASVQCRLRHDRTSIISHLIARTHSRTNERCHSDS